MSERRTVKTVLQYEVDQRSVRTATQSADAVESSLKGISAEIGKLGPMTRANVTDIQTRFAALKTQASQEGEVVRQTTAAYTRLGQARQDSYATAAQENFNFVNGLREEIALANQAGGGGSGGAFKRVGNFGRELRLLPAAPIPGTGQSTDAIGKILQVAGNGLDSLGVSLTQFAGYAGVTALAVAGITAAFAFFTSENEKAAATLKRIIAFQKDYYTLILTGTRDQVQAARDAKAEELAIAEAQLVENVRIAARFQQDLQEQTGTQILDALVGRGFTRDIGSLLNAGGLQDLDKSSTDLITTIQQLESDLGRLDNALRTDATAFQDAEAAAQAAAIEIINGIVPALNELARQAHEANLETQRSVVGRAEAQRQEIEQNAEFSRQSSDELTRLTSMRRVEIGALKNTIVELEASAIQGEEVTRALEDYRAELAGLEDDVAEITSSYIPMAKAREAEAQAAETAAKALQDAAAKGLEVASASRSMIQAEQDLAKARTDSQQRINEINLRRTDAESEALNDRNNALSEAQFDYQRGREDQERDHQARLLEINRRANATIANAIGARDALAAYLAEQGKKQEAREETRANREAVRRLNAALGDQQRVIEQRYTQQLQTARTAAQRALEIEAQKANAEIALRQNALNVAIQQYTQFFNQLQALYQAAIANSVNAGAGGQVIIPTVNYISPEQAQAMLGVSGRAYGGAVNSGQRVLVGEHGPEIAYFRSPAMVMSNRASRSGAGAGMDMTFNVNLIGQTPEQSAREAGRQVEQYVNKVLKAAKQKRGLS